MGLRVALPVEFRMAFQVGSEFLRSLGANVKSWAEERPHGSCRIWGDGWARTIFKGMLVFGVMMRRSPTSSVSEANGPLGDEGVFF